MLYLSVRHFTSSVSDKFTYKRQRQKLTGKKKTKLKVTPCCVEYDTYTEIIAIDKGNYHINTLKAEIKFILGKKTDFFSYCNKSQEKAEAECKTAIDPLNASNSSLWRCSFQSWVNWNWMRPFQWKEKTKIFFNNLEEHQLDLRRP